MQPSVTDLFGEVIVTHDEISAWLEAVPRMSPDSPRAAAYVKSYSVVDKIKDAKLRGEFERITARREMSDYWWRRFNWG